MSVSRKRQTIFEAIAKISKLKLIMKKKISSEKKFAAVQSTFSSILTISFVLFKRIRKFQKTKSFQTDVRMFKISIIEFVFLFSSRSIIQFVFQNFNYYVSLTMSSKAKNENDEKKNAKNKKKELTDLIMREIQFMNDFDENEKNSFRFAVSFSSEFSFKKSKSSDKSKKIRSLSLSSAIFYVFNEKLLYDKKTMLKNSVFYKINSSNDDDVFCLMFCLAIIKFKAFKHAEIKFFVCHLIRMKTLIF